MSDEYKAIEKLEKQHSFNCTMQLAWCITLFAFGPMMLGVIGVTNGLGGVLPWLGWVAAAVIFFGAYVGPILYFGHMQTVLRKEINRRWDAKYRIRKGLE